ncbi:MAG: DUF4065 domain-containing protein [Oscillospiraceae bacterium]|nr:DUF4065 domain-containing protein [Oscillospiraceae bacterium]
MESAKSIARVFEYLSLQSEGTPIEKTRLNKLLYFAQGHSLSELGHELFKNDVDAWDHGPVVSVVWTGFDKILEKTNKDGIADITIAPEEMDLILDVWDQYRAFSAGELVKRTHEEGTPWKAVYVPNTKNTHIPKELMRQFFMRPENRLRQFSDEIKNLPSVSALPAEEYDPDEDAIWEGQLNDTP